MFISFSSHPCCAFRFISKFHLVNGCRWDWARHRAPPQCFHTSPTHSIPRCSLLSWQGTKKKWGTLETRLTQMSQLQPSQLLYTVSQRVGRMWHFLRAYYVSSPTPALLVYEFTGDRMWQLVLGRFNCQLDTVSICQEINAQWGTAFLRLLCGHVWRCFKLTDVGSPNSLWAVPLPRGPEHYC